jgi:molecular chaperone GrpE
VERLRAEVADLKDRYLRALADMDNVRKRARLDADDARKFANEGLVSELLPVLDNFARAIEAAEQSPNFEALKSGVDLIHRQLSEVLTRAGLQKIDAMGQPFDPNVHEAIMQVEPQEGQEPHQVVEELRAGYRFSDRVVRPTLVKVTSG